VDLARHLLGQFGSLRALLEADQVMFSMHLGWARQSSLNCRQPWK
jgi:DNA repair protein RadC